MFKCDCNREFETRRSLNSHAGHCNQYIRIKEPFVKLTEYKCTCGKEFDNAQSLNSHYRHCEFKRGHKVEYEKGFMSGWDKFTEEEIKEFHNKSGKTLSDNVKSGKTILPPQSLAKREAQSILASYYITRSDRVKNYEVFCPYENVIVQGTWEYNVALLLNENNIIWTKGPEIDIRYQLEGEELRRRYNPDFYLIEKDFYLEVKGYYTDENKLKMKTVYEQNKDKKMYLLHAPRLNGVIEQVKNLLNI